MEASAITLHEEGAPRLAHAKTIELQAAADSQGLHSNTDVVVI